MRTPEIKKWVVVGSVVLLGALQFPVLYEIIPGAITGFEISNISLTMILGILMFVSAYWVGRSETA
jgi:hypothetical protein